MWQLYIKYGKISFMDKNKSISTQKIHRWDVGYFILYGIVLAKCVYETTMFSQQVLVGTFKLFLAAMVLYTGAKVLFSGDSFYRKNVSTIFPDITAEKSSLQLP